MFGIIHETNPDSVNNIFSGLIRIVINRFYCTLPYLLHKKNFLMVYQLNLETIILANNELPMHPFMKQIHADFKNICKT